jgi:uncharacterized protein (DUF1800 family)
MDRREFISNSFSETHDPASTSSVRSQTGLSPYAGPWTLSEVKHLLRRAFCGAPKSECDYFLSQGMTASISEILTPLSSPPSAPLHVTTAYADPNVPFGQTWVNAPIDVLANPYRKTSFRSWWIGQLLNPGRSITEKMVLFWHNHFVTELNIVIDARYMYNYNALLRQYALGNFKSLTKQVTIDVAMLRYLNGALNTAAAPDENYGRELQELFTVGKDANGIPYYSETDVQNAAKVLTGYRVDAVNAVSFFDSTKHDTSDKVFSAYYGNTTIYGQTGQAGQNELDDLLNMIFARQEVALNICRKLYRFFVYYEIDQTTEQNVIQPLAQIFISNNFEILPVLQALFSSEHFFDMANRGALIKTPVDFTVSLCRDLSVAFPGASSPSDQYSLWYRVFTQTTNMGQSVGDPPNVAGWPAYYSEPLFHELWINSTTLPARNIFSDRMLNNGYSTGSASIVIDVVNYVQTLNDPLDPNALVQELIDLHYCFDVSQTLKDFLKSYLLSGQLNDSYWTIAWMDYTGAPTDQTYYNIVQSRLKSMFIYLLDLAEYQLS